MGDPRPFDHANHEVFQRILVAHGSAAGIDIKGKIVAAIAEGQPPWNSDIAADRAIRTSIRVVLRQMTALRHPSRSLASWLEAFDRIEVKGEDDDETQPGH